VKDEKGVLVGDSHSILAKWTNFFSQLLNVHGVNEVRQTEIHTAKPLVTELSASEFELVIEKLKSNKPPGIDQIPAELTKKIHCEIHKLIISIWIKEELPEEWKESIMVSIYKKGDKTDCSNYGGISLFAKYVQNFIQHSAFKVNSISRGNYWMWISMLQVNY
jgi:hypothetical protein